MQIWVDDKEDLIKREAELRGGAASCGASKPNEFFRARSAVRGGIRAGFCGEWAAVRPAVAWSVVSLQVILDKVYRYPAFVLL